MLAGALLQCLPGRAPNPTNIGNTRPKSGQFWPIAAKIGPIWATLGQTLANFGQQLARIARSTELSESRCFAFVFCGEADVRVPEPAWRNFGRQGTRKSTSPQNNEREAAPLVKLRALSADFWPEFRMTPAPDLRPVILHLREARSRADPSDTPTAAATSAVACGRSP